MNITALIKVWSGEEWLKACVESIYPYVHKIVLLTSDISWIGGRGNPSLPIIREIQKCRDKEKKVIHINRDEPNQIKHCMEGYNYIKQNIRNTDWIQLIDSDELWDKANYEKAIKILQERPNEKAFRTQMYTYIKSPYYRVDPPEPLKPCCFIKPNLPDMGLEPRGCAIKPFYTMPDVWCHHFVFVRSHFNKVLEKLIQSHVSEKQPYEKMNLWIPEVWNRLPNVPMGWTIPRGGFHPAIGFGRNWKKIRVVPLEELPEILHNKRYPEILKFGE
jgi:hypothetical protein